MTTEFNAKIATETDSDEESSTFSGEYEESTGSTNSYSYNTYRSEDNFDMDGCFNGANQKWESDGETDVTLFEILEAVDNAVDSVVDVIIPKETNEDTSGLPDNTKERKVRPVLADEDMGIFNKVFPSSPRKVKPVPIEEKTSRGRGLFYKKSLNIDTDDDEGDRRRFKSFSPRMLSPKRMLSPRRKKKVALEPADTDETSTDDNSFSPRVFSPKRILSPKREKYTVSAVDTDETTREEDSSYFGGKDLAAMFQAMSPKNANAYDDNDDESIISKTLNWMSGEQPKKEQTQQEVIVASEEKKSKRSFFKRNKKRSPKQSTMEEVKYRPEGAEYIWSFTNKNEKAFDANQLKYEESTATSSYSDETRKKRGLFRRRKRQGKSKYSVFQ